MAVNITEISGYTSSYDVLGYLLRLMSSFWHRKLNAELAEIDLTEMQFVLLIGLGWLTSGKTDKVTQRELADYCGCSKALASQVMKKLVAKKLVSIGIDEKDARANMVSLTASGEKRLSEALVILRKTDIAFRGENPEIYDRLFHALRDAVAVSLDPSEGNLQELGAMPR